MSERSQQTEASEESEPGAHPAGIRRAAAIAALAASFAWIPYLVPGLEELRVLRQGDPLPLARLVHGEPPSSANVNVGGVLNRQAAIVRDEDALLARAPLPAPLPPPLPVEPAAQSAQRGGLARVDPAELRGLTREIEDPSGAMRAYYARLGRVARGEPVLARMGVYGTSIDGADRATAQVRRLLAARFGDGGKGWVPLAPGWRYQRHQDVAWQAEHWRTFVVNRGDAPLDRYGFGGVLAVDRHRGARARFATHGGEGPGSAVSVFRVFHQAWPEGGELAVSIDGGPPRLVSTRAEAVEDRVETFSVPDGAHALSLAPVQEGGETLRLYGVVMERDGPGSVVDSLALIGAFTRVLRLYDEDHFATQVRQREPDLLAFWMGSNDAVSASVPFIRDQYVRHYRTVLSRFRAARPEGSCLVISILDTGEREGGRIRTRRRVPRLVEAQREVAFAEGCAFFDAYQATGGAGTMRRWYRASPRLVTDDLGHLTEAGSRLAGTLLHRALLAGYDGWIAAGEPAP